MSNDEPEIIDAEVVEDDNLPAVIESEGTNRRSTPMDDPRAGPRDWSSYASPERRCKAHKKNGDQCKNASVPGATVCRFHGGAAKHVKAAARARLENAADLMAKQLLGIALTAESEAVKLAAIKDSLDRAGLRPPTEVALSQGEPKPYEELFEGIATLSREESRARRGYSDSPATQPLGQPTDTSREHKPECPPATVVGPSSQSGPAREPGPRVFDREGDTEPPIRHVTGDEAIRQANEANRQIGALKAIESGGHVRYRRP